MYMVDSSGGAATIEETEIKANRMRSDFVKAGFVQSEKKCE